MTGEESERNAERGEQQSFEEQSDQQFVARRTQAAQDCQIAPSRPQRTVEGREHGKCCGQNQYPREGAEPVQPDANELQDS